MATQQRSGTAVGFISLAGIFLFTIGGLQIIAGFVGLVNNDFYVVTDKYAFEFSTTSWGWIHILVGCLMLGAGIAIFSGAVWARTVAVIVALINIVVNFVWLPHYPIWGLLLIVLDVFVIWAVTAHGRDITAE